MKISPDILEAIIGRSDLNFDQDGTRRFASRVAVSKRATFCRSGSSVQIPVTIVDLSTGGVGIMAAAKPSPGDRFVLRARGQNDERLTVDCIVSWSKTMSSGRCRIGAEFLTIVEDRESDDTYRRAELGVMN